MKRTSAGSAQLACYISVHNVPVPLSALRRMVLQNFKHVAWLAYQLELKETQQHRDNEVNHVSVVGRLRAVGHVSTCCLPSVTTGHQCLPFPPSPVPRRPFLGRTYHDSGLQRRGSRTERETPARSYRLNPTASAAAAVRRTLLHLLVSPLMMRLIRLIFAPFLVSVLYSLLNGIASST